jgi:hypothetical protein
MNKTGLSEALNKLIEQMKHDLSDKYLFAPTDREQVQAVVKKGPRAPQYLSTLTSNKLD